MFLVKQGVPSDEDLEWLSHKLENWEELGRRLGIDDATLTAFDDDYKKKRKKIYKMLGLDIGKRRMAQLQRTRSYMMHCVMNLLSAQI